MQGTTMTTEDKNRESTSVSNVCSISSLFYTPIYNKLMVWPLRPTLGALFHRYAWRACTLCTTIHRWVHCPGAPAKPQGTRALAPKGSRRAVQRWNWIRLCVPVAFSRQRKRLNITTVTRVRDPSQLVKHSVSCAFRLVAKAPYWDNRSNMYHVISEWAVRFPTSYVNGA